MRVKGSHESMLLLFDARSILGFLNNVCLDDRHLAMQTQRQSVNIWRVDIDRVYNDRRREK